MTADASGLRNALADWAFGVIDGAVSDVPDLVRPFAPIGEVTPTSTRAPGQLRESITVGSAPSPGGPDFAAKVIAPVIQARTTDQGSPPHPIDGNPFLRFWWPNGPAGAKIYVFRHVNHPGNAAANWWEPALRAAYAQALLARVVSTSFAAV